MNGLDIDAADAAMQYLMAEYATAPLKVALLTEVPTAPGLYGTEVAGAGYQRKEAEFTYYHEGSYASLDSDLLWTNMPACTVNGFAVYDSAASPLRLWFAPFVNPMVFGAGDSGKIMAGYLGLNLEGSI